MNILITGGTGFIGSHLVNRISNEGHHVSVLSRTGTLPANLAGNDFVIVKGDFGDEKILDTVLPGIDIVIHLAWTSVPSQDIKQIELDVVENINGTISLLNKCVTCQVKKFIFISSGGTVYGIPQESPITEEHNLDPISSYGVSKVAIEKYLHLYNKLFALDYVVFRISNAYGEYQNLQKGQGVVGIWLDNILSGKELVIWGDGSVIRDYIYVSDIVDAILQALTAPLKQRIYNLGSGQGFSLNDIINLIRVHVTDDFKVKYIQKRDIDVPVNVLDITRLANETGYSPSVSLSEGMIRVWNWVKLNR